MLFSPFSMMVITAIVVGVFSFIIAYLIFKGRSGSIFEFETFEDTVINNLDNTFKLQGHKSKARITHGFNNPLGSVDKWLVHKGEWVIMQYDVTSKKYIKKLFPVKKKKLDGKGKEILDGKGRVTFEVTNEPTTEKYNLILFKVKGDGIFESSNYIVADSNLVKFDGKANRFNIDSDAQLHSFGKAWITSSVGERYLSDISFRKSIEGNMTYLQNYARKIIFVETSHAKAISKIEGKSDAKTSGYQAFATNTLIRDSQSTDDDE